MRRIAILDAPSNLGLRPPTATSVPGCAKAPGALRDHGLIDRLHARDAGCLTPPRYDPGDWRPGDGVSHAGEIATYSRRLADRIGAIIDAGEFPLVLGGDCSIVLGSGLAMHRLGDAVGGRIGLVFVDGHSDFRHPGNASYVGAAAGEDLALVTGRGQTDLAAIEGRRPYFRDVDVVVMGIRAQDEYRLDLQAAGIVTRPVPTLRVEGAARSAQWARDQLVDCAGYWVHVDMDVLDPAVMPAVDAPEPGGIAFAELELLLAGLVDTPHCLGVEITVFDPDYDPDGAYAEEIAATIVAGLAPVRTVAARPDLIAARRDLAARTDGTGGDGRGAERFGPGRLAPAGLGPAGLGERDRGEPEPGDVEPDEPRPGGLRPGGLRPEGLASDEPRPGGLRPGGLLPGGLAPGGLRPEGPSSDELRLGGLRPGGLAPGGLAPGRLRPAAMAADDGDEPDPVVSRRAAAAADSVTLAAAGMSGGGSAGPDEAAAPATTLLGVEEAGEAEAHSPAEYQREQPADDETDVADETAGDDRAGYDDDETDLAGEAAGEEPAGEDEAGYQDAAEGDDGHGHADEPVDYWSDDNATGEDGDPPGPDHDDAPEEDDAVDVGDHNAAEDHADDGRPPFGRADGIPAQPVSRPLGSSPLLDSQPLPATRPGLLRPRTADGFSLPAQRPAFDAGSDQPADIA